MKTLYIIFSLILLSGCDQISDSLFNKDLKRLNDKIDRIQEELWKVETERGLEKYDRETEKSFKDHLTKLLDYKDGYYRATLGTSPSIKLCDGKRRYLETQPPYRIEDRAEKAEVKK